MVDLRKATSEASTELKVVCSTGVGADIFNGEYNAYLGISFSKTRYFSREVVRRYVVWTLQRFDRMLIIIADHLEIHNQVVFKGRSYDEAAKATRSAAMQYRTAYLKVTSEFSDRLDIVLASDLLAIPACAELARHVANLCLGRPDLYEAVCDTVRYALEGKLEERFPQSVPAEAMDRLAQYFIEELAIIVYLTEVNEPLFTVSIFPYPPPGLLVDFYGGRFDLTESPLARYPLAPYQALQVVT